MAKDQAQTSSRDNAIEKAKQSIANLRQMRYKGEADDDAWYFDEMAKVEEQKHYRMAAIRRSAGLVTSVRLPTRYLPLLAMLKRTLNADDFGEKADGDYEDGRKANDFG